MDADGASMHRMDRTNPTEAPMDRKQIIIRKTVRRLTVSRARYLASVAITDNPAFADTAALNSWSRASAEYRTLTGHAHPLGR